MDWISFCIPDSQSILTDTVFNRQNFEVIMMLVIFVLQREHDLSDFKLEKQSID